MYSKSKAFALVETLVVSTFVATILIYLFVQFTTLQNKYNESFRYNDIDDLYKLNNIKNFIKSLPTDNQKKIEMEIDTNNYIIINNNDNIDYLDNQTNLFDSLDMKTLIITKADVSSIKGVSKNIQKMLKNINNKSENYRLIVEFNNLNCATITFSLGEL